MHTMRGRYVGELEDGMVVDKHLGNLGNIGSSGNQGNAGPPLPSCSPLGFASRDPACIVAVIDWEPTRVSRIPSVLGGLTLSA